MAEQELCKQQRVVTRPRCATHPRLKARPDAGIEERLKALAARRKLSDLSVGPVLTWTNERMEAHVDRLLQIPGAP